MPVDSGVIGGEALIFRLYGLSVVDGGPIPGRISTTPHTPDSCDWNFNPKWAVSRVETVCKREAFGDTSVNMVVKGSIM